MNYLFVTWDVNPIFINIFGLEIAYYGILWAAAFGVGLWLMGKMVKKEGLDPEVTGSSFMYAIISTVVGARLGHCLFYDPMYYLANPLSILNIREGGLASHGAAIGLLVGIWLFSRKWKTPYIWMLDRIGIVVAIGGALIRLGNLMNSEIYGTPTTLPWGFIFPQGLEKFYGANGELLAVHPTQIYEALAYLILFAVLAHMYWMTKISDRRGVMFGVFLIGLFASRFFIESIKNVQATFEQGMLLNMGQWLSLPFIIAGVVILVIALRRKPQPYLNMPVAKPVTRSEKRHGKTN